MSVLMWVLFEAIGSKYKSQKITGNSDWISQVWTIGRQTSSADNVWIWVSGPHNWRYSRTCVIGGVCCGPPGSTIT